MRKEKIRKNRIKRLKMQKKEEREKRRQRRLLKKQIKEELAKNKVIHPQLPRASRCEVCGYDAWCSHNWDKIKGLTKNEECAIIKHKEVKK